MHAGNGLTSPTTSPSSPDWIDRIVRRWPEAPLIAPFFTFLALMALAGAFDEAYKPWLYALRTFGALFVALAFRRHWPPLGKLYLHWCLLVGLIVAVGWVVIHKWFAGGVVAGQYVFAGFDWYSLSQFAGKDPTPAEYYIPHDQLGAGLAYWAFLIVRIGGAATVVPIVEELFWRGFVLRVLIDWHRFEDVPLGKFTWFSFVVCSLGSALEHPQWEVGILCWVVYNLLFYHTRSLLCLMVTHGITNLVLYVYVVRYEDWVFW